LNYFGSSYYRKSIAGAALGVGFGPDNVGPEAERMTMVWSSFCKDTGSGKKKTLDRNEIKSFGDVVERI
jgi:hypothetical protein